MTSNFAQTLGVWLIVELADPSRTMAYMDAMIFFLFVVNIKVSDYKRMLSQTKAILCVLIFDGVSAIYGYTSSRSTSVNSKASHVINDRSSRLYSTIGYDFFTK